MQSSSVSRDMDELKFLRRMPMEAHLEVVGDPAGMRADPGFVCLECDPDLAGALACLIAGSLAIV